MYKNLAAASRAAACVFFAAAILLPPAQGQTRTASEPVKAGFV